MKRTRLRNNFLKHRCEANKRTYKTQRNLWVSLVKKTKKEYFDNFDHKKITDNKISWKTTRPFFTNKGINKESITLVQNGETLSTAQYDGPKVDTGDISDPLLKAITEHKNYSSVRKIKK